MYGECFLIVLTRPGLKSAARRDYFQADGQILLLGGWNHIEMKLAGLHAASYQRQFALDRMRRFTLAISRGVLPCALRSGGPEAER
jgi:hypothetical protein